MACRCWPPFFGGPEAYYRSPSAHCRCYNHSGRIVDSTHRAYVMIRLPALLLAGCVVSGGLILLGGGSGSPLFERSPPATEIKTGAQAREIVEPLHGATQHLPQSASSDNAGGTAAGWCSAWPAADTAPGGRPACSRTRRGTGAARRGQTPAAVEAIGSKRPGAPSIGGAPSLA